MGIVRYAREWVLDGAGMYPMESEIDPPSWELRRFERFSDYPIPRMQRGGGFFQHARSVGSASRREAMPDCHFEDLGIRVLKTGPKIGTTPRAAPI